MSDTATTLAKISDTAKTGFLQNGFLGASLRNIVKKAGVTTGAFYGYYKNKKSSVLLLPSKRKQNRLLLIAKRQKCSVSFCAFIRACV